MKKSTHKKVWPLLICFLLPVFIMAFYFAYRNMSPFGNRSILTVDLGQQYVDFFAYFRHTLLSDPSGLFYSFSKAFGGEMFGTWAYYLMSPINLLLLLFPTQHLPAGILIVTLIKYGLSGLSFGYLLSKSIKPNSALTIMWSVIYALNGWIIANQLNIMWLDGMIWLPLVVLGIHQIFNGQPTKTYLIAMTLAIITNYYIAYMIALFTVIYVIFKFTTSSLNATQLKSVVKRLFLDTFYSFCLTAWLTLPTLASLKQGKAHYSFPHVRFTFEYFPFKMFSKLFNGALDFNQLPNGLPNIFVGSVALISFFIYLSRHDIPLRQRLGSFLITLILILSMCYRPLDLLWHAGQFPIWYPDRFSFIFCFWIIWIAAHGINSSYSVSWITMMIIVAILGSLIIYVFLNLPKFPFISPLNFATGILFLLITFVLLIYTHNGTRLFSFALMILSIFEMTLNANNSLNNLSYISNASYTKYTENLSYAVNKIHSRQPNRIGKTFYRSKDDPFSNNYIGGDAFDSSLEYTTPKFMEQIGQPEGSGFVTYTNGTLLSDQLLGFRYYLTNDNHQYNKCVINRPDVINYPGIHRDNNLVIHKNSNVLPLIFPTYPKALTVKLNQGPIMNQERLYQAITNRNDARFKPLLFNSVRQNNLRIHQGQLITNNPLIHGTSNLTLRPKLNHAYYLLIGPQINNKDCKITMNGHELLPNTAYNHPIILNISSGTNVKPIHFQIQPFQSKLDLRPFQLYQLNKQPIKHRFMNHSHVHIVNNRKVTGSFKSTVNQPVMGTSIPATNGWHLKIDGQSRKIYKIAGEFIGAKVKPGKHNVKLTFTPPYLPLGSLITLLTILAMLLKYLMDKTNKKPDQ